LAAEKSEIFPSKGDLRRTVKGGGVSVNKEKLEDADMVIDTTRLINDKYLLVQKGKKNYFLIKVD
jgi:tyrosyl-tRNA synthetase